MELVESFEWEGRTVACGRAGTGPDVVFCHGTPFSSRVWSAYADALAADFTVHLWDMPGYGQSSMHAEHDVSFRSQAACLAALLEHWELDRPHVVSHDFGGAVSLRATLTEGARYASLLLVDVVAIPPSGSPFFRYVGEHADALAELPAYIHEAVIRAYISGASHAGLRPEAADELAAPWLTESGQPAFYRQIAAYDESVLVDIEQRLPDLSCPVTVLWATDDAWIPIQTGRRLAQLAGADLTELSGAGHLAPLDAPVAVMSALRRWLTTQT